MIKALGLMSGTSLDGVDVALIETNGERIGGFGPTCWQPYSDGERALLRAALAAAVDLTDRKARPRPRRSSRSPMPRRWRDSWRKTTSPRRISP
jgi:1,6-anhydro-N-acetylmuramate kinase